LFGPDFATKSIVEEETNPDAASKSNDKRHSSPRFSTAATELTKQNIVRFPTGCKRLDKLLDGGIESGVITQIYGDRGLEKHNSVILCV
jgi:RecA/RadA recombinase